MSASTCSSNPVSTYDRLLDALTTLVVTTLCVLVASGLFAQTAYAHSWDYATGTASPNAEVSFGSSGFAVGGSPQTFHYDVQSAYPNTCENWPPESTWPEGMNSYIRRINWDKTPGADWTWHSWFNLGCYPWTMHFDGTVPNEHQGSGIHELEFRGENSQAVYLHASTVGQEWTRVGGGHSCDDTYLTDERRRVTCHGDPVNTATGSFVTSVTDLSFPGAGTPFQLERSYTSADTKQGPLGTTWTHNLNTSITTDESGDYELRGPDGQMTSFKSREFCGFAKREGRASTLSRASVGDDYADEVMGDSPSGYWRFEEQSGTTAVDETSNNNDATYKGGVTLGIDGAPSGAQDAAMDTDGVNGRL